MMWRKASGELDDAVVTGLGIELRTIKINAENTVSETPSVFLVTNCRHTRIKGPVLDESIGVENGCFGAIQRDLQG